LSAEVLTQADSPWDSKSKSQKWLCFLLSIGKIEICGIMKAQNAF
jgi:hypothetical protein